MNKNLDKLICSNPNIFFNFNINKLNCPFPLEMMNQINKKLKDYQTVNKKQRNRDMHGIYNSKAVQKQKTALSQQKVNNHSDPHKQSNLYINVIDQKEKGKEESLRPRKYKSHIDEHLMQG